MLSTKFKWLLVLVLGFLFNMLFWQENLGPNLPIFIISLLGAALLAFPKARFSPTVWVLGAGVLFTAIMVAITGSGTAKVGLILSGVTLSGAILVTELRTLPTMIAVAWIHQLAGFVAAFMDSFKQKEQKAPKRRYSVLAMSVVPLLVAVVFLLIYSVANPKLASMLGDFGEWINLLFVDFPFARIGFIIVGCVIAMGALWKFTDLGAEKWEGHQMDGLVRKHLGTKKFTIGLRKEFRAGIFLLLLLNALGLLVNAIDISWIWFNFKIESDMNLSQLVHEGTWMLILSILLAMAVVFFLFRGNLNYFSQNKPLRVLAYVWLVQNTLMVVSVAIRNFHYMDYHGLAYKRIGVYFFLMLVLFGLGMVAWKITYRKSFFFVIRTNSWATFAILMLLCSFNWDLVIARYNISHSKDIDLDRAFLLSLSDKTLPILLENEAVFKDYHLAPRYETDYYTGSMLNYLDAKTTNFIYRYEGESWLSHSLADHRAYEYVKQYKEKMRQNHENS